MDATQTPEGAAWTVIQPIGEIDANTVTGFRRQLAQAASPGGLIVDLTKVPLIDSAGLGALVGGVRSVRQLGGHVVVAGPRPLVARVLAMTGFNRIADVAPSLGGAARILREWNEGHDSDRGSFDVRGRYQC